MDNIEDLIDIIYESTENPSIWPFVSKSLSLNPSPEPIISLNKPNKNLCLKQNLINSPAFLGFDDKQKKLEIIAPHIDRCVSISNRIYQLQSQIQSIDSLIDKLPFAVLIIKKSGQLICANSLGKTLLDKEYTLIKNNQIKLRTTLETNRLYSHINEVIEGSALAKSVSMELSPTLKNEPYTILITRTERQDVSHTDSCCLYFIPFKTQNISNPKILRETYGLSPAESLTTYHLINGQSVDEIAGILKLSKNTIRSHLKSSFSKTNTHSQSSLVSLILKGPAILRLSQKQKIVLKGLDCNITTKEDFVTLQDSRKIAFRQYGCLTGIPILLFHDLFSCRFFNPDSNNTLQKLNIRLLVIERPGYGISDSHENGSFETFTSDVTEILQKLRIQSVHILGHSVGASYALSFVNSHPEMCKSISLVSSIVPCYSLNDLATIKCAIAKLAVGFSLHAPHILKPLINAFSIGIVSDTDQFIQDQIDYLHPADRKALFQPEVYDQFILGFQESMRSGGRGFYKDILSMTTNWSIILKKIATPAHIWHGTDDNFAHWHLAQKLRSLPNHTTTLIQGGGHFILHNNWEKILKSLIYS